MHHKLVQLKRDDSPFSKKIPVNGKVTWVKPVLVCTVKYTEITADGILRHPVFMGLRIDKAANEATTIDTTVSSENQNNKRKRKTSKEK
jgi:bifunctional non-homologous end joining protein LigD